jgi:hypothetical protein
MPNHCCSLAGKNRTDDQNEPFPHSAMIRVDALIIRGHFVSMLRTSFVLQ